MTSPADASRLELPPPADRPLQVGDRIPRFALPDADGRVVASDELLGKGPVVIYFYPKDDTPGCTAEACSFRDEYEVFKDAGAEVVGLSGDDATAHAAFRDKHRLPFVLLSDKANAVRKAFGVKSTLGLLPGRSTYVVDAQGLIRHKFDSQLFARKHVSEALEAVKRIASGG